ncbi:MAG: hypothetical protein ACK5IM_10335 [Demequina sp.]|uniref:hypothetical protein n=1 Tax=Demequina sp. TaxID=2050685 RepID=UPI003A844069
MLLAFSAGVITLNGHPWWAVPLALCAIANAHGWITSRLERANEPTSPAWGAFVVTAFTIWLLIPIWRGVVHGETIPFPEAFIFAGLAPAVWLALYVVLLVRR